MSIPRFTAEVALARSRRVYAGLAPGGRDGAGVTPQQGGTTGCYTEPSVDPECFSDCVEAGFTRRNCRQSCSTQTIVCDPFPRPPFFF